jgi:hypothetical protein
MGRKLTIASSVLWGIAALGVSDARATVVVDQSQTSFNATSGFLGSTQAFAQTFTVSESGRLFGIEVVLDGSQPIQLRLLDTSNGVPTFNVIAASTAMAGNDPEFVYFDFSNLDVQVTQGELLAFEPFSDVSNGQTVGEYVGWGDVN